MTVAARDAGLSPTSPGTLSAGLRRTVRSEAPLWLEIAALTSFVIARPVLGSFGRSTEVFIVRGADRWEVLAFSAALLLVPPLTAGAFGALFSLGGEVPRRLAHAATVGLLSSVALWQLAQHLTDPPPAAVAACLVAGAGLGALRWKAAWFAAFLRYAAVGGLVFAGQFLLASPTAAIVLSGRDRGIDPDVTAAVEAAVGDDGPPVVVVALDGLPTNLLLDGRGRIDASLYPNLAALAADATWYRNNTTVAPFTLEAVPAILTGTAPTDGSAPVTGRYPRNLFTLLGGVYEVHAGERLTGLCPVSLCPAAGLRAVPHLLADARELWEMQLRGEGRSGLLVPGAFSGRYEDFGGWIDEQDFTPGGRPDLFFYHLLLPHDPWDYLPDGSRYAALGPPSGLLHGYWGDWGTDVARQRHVLQTQAADGLLGRLFDRLREAGAYDDALIVVTADHGYSFDLDSPWRGLSEDNFDDIMWAPLIVKSPNQRAGRVDDVNITTADVLPTIADELGIDVPWDLEGVPAAEIERSPDTKAIEDSELSEWRSAGGGPVEVDGAEGLARVLASDAGVGTGPLAVWQRTAYGGLTGEPVDRLRVGEPRPERAAVDGLERWDDVDPEVPLLELVATAPVAVDTPVAVTVNGTVAAMTRAAPTPFGVSIVHGLVWPGAVEAGPNEVALYVVEGDPEDPVLHELVVEPAS